MGKRKKSSLLYPRELHILGNYNSHQKLHLVVAHFLFSLFPFQQPSFAQNQLLPTDIKEHHFFAGPEPPIDIQQELSAKTQRKKLFHRIILEKTDLTSRDSSYTRLNLPVLNQNTRILRSGDVIANCLPSGLT